MLQRFWGSFASFEGAPFKGAPIDLAVTEHVFRLNAGAPERRTTRTTSRTSNIKLQTRRFRTPEELLSRLQDRGSRGKLYRRLIVAPRSPYRPQEKFIYQVLCVESEFRG